MPLGGQAVLEGVLLTDGQRAALAVRTPQGIVVEALSVPRFPRLERLPFVRGAVKLYQLLAVGLAALERSAALAFPEEKGSPGGFALAVGLALLLLVGGFIVLPLFLATRTGLENRVLLNLVEGGIRVAFFALYLGGIAFLPDVRRLFQYHGAEHKVVHAYEAGEPSLDGALKHSPLHARCGTNFVFLFIAVALLLFSLVPAEAFWVRLLVRLGLLPVVAGITYELLQLGARTPALAPLLWPGLFFQRLTTREPEPGQIEVALAALRQLLAERSSSTTE
ncbi:MAG: DUF1385 domain-containing protein [Candidatus Bipolaricaulota bacterium]|nr:DUF1385 domain-containing protein [Candidatus Bipolaricaulota bacterium]MCX7844660.1 DUF1385 domain-containing protein [Candidatus Bipolaricaulota bacterium]MDW8151312.1 DUF1385 domain-containing protein [Candidatus Bipolaricaulota bacterium]